MSLWSQLHPNECDANGNLIDSCQAVESESQHQSDWCCWHCHNQENKHAAGV